MDPGHEGYVRTTSDNKVLLHSFTTETIFDLLGGMGRYQLVHVFLMVVFRNFGTLPIYVFALSTKELPLECKMFPKDVFIPCTLDKICQLRDIHLEGFEYRPDKSHPGFFFNWWLEYDLVCNSQIIIKQCVSSVFLGYLLGFFLFFLPDKVGRKKAMVFSLFTSGVGLTLVIFGRSLVLKQLGFFILGVFHLRITLAFTYAIELVPQRHKEKVQILINSWDTLTIVMACVFFECFKTESTLLRGFYYLGMASIGLFIFVVPESPLYLLKRDPGSKEARSLLNYVAWFNGSNYRISENAQLISSDVSDKSVNMSFISQLNSSFE